MRFSKASIPESIPVVFFFFPAVSQANKLQKLDGVSLQKFPTDQEPSPSPALHYCKEWGEPPLASGKSSVSLPTHISTQLSVENKGSHLPSSPRPVTFWMKCHHPQRGCGSHTPQGCSSLLHPPMWIFQGPFLGALGIDGLRTFENIWRTPLIKTHSSCAAGSHRRKHSCSFVARDGSIMIP